MRRQERFSALDFAEVGPATFRYSQASSQKKGYQEVDSLPPSDSIPTFLSLMRRVSDYQRGQALAGTWKEIASIAELEYDLDARLDHWL
ncbi:uncharacterized protein BJ212DRAFT_1389868 [Suillus subaureus]|uniref:Uncharacterized protein n=1 Tax=Suillus subaureus TaxID=48587 RepID=A0A9P7DXY6_9AGAM|nr:uncharacterized protein BJ212DRAFT_1389868 [Suillus subaureus]KAG1806133.1 hypothetical protein BJ212DRAFT_1389868 [Suillus subaureus]